MLLNCTFPYPLGLRWIAGHKLHHINLTGLLRAHSSTVSAGEISSTVPWTISKNIIVKIRKQVPVIVSIQLLPDNKLVTFIRNLIDVWPWEFRYFNMIFKY